ncbi:MAG: indolepyruvate ferredoxin oxidoreductase family protein, partial [Nevskiaceae bacterium]
SANTPTAEFITNPKWQFPEASAERNLKEAIGQDCEFIDARALAVQLLGDAIYTNPLMLGYVWQKGWVPLSHESLVRAIELNDVMVEKNLAAFEWGRAIAERGPAAVAPELKGSKAENTGMPEAAAQVIAMPETLAALIERNAQMLTAYQNAAYAKRYVDAVKSIQTSKKSISDGQAQELARAIAQNLAKLMAYKDEYEVARLYADPAFTEKLCAQFEGEPGKDYRLKFYLAPPLLAKKDDKGHLIKKQYGPWMMHAFRLLAKFKGLRGTALDVFGKTAERRQERQLVDDYLALVRELAQSVNAHNIEPAIDLAKLPDDIRGFGHIKDANLAAAQKRREMLLRRYRGEAELSRVA